MWLCRLLSLSLDILVAAAPQLLRNDRHGMAYGDIWPDKRPRGGPPKTRLSWKEGIETPDAREANQSSAFIRLL